MIILKDELSVCFDVCVADSKDENLCVTGLTRGRGQICKVRVKEHSHVLLPHNFLQGFSHEGKSDSEAGQYQKEASVRLDDEMYFERGLEKRKEGRRE